MSLFRPQKMGFDRHHSYGCWFNFADFTKKGPGTLWGTPAQNSLFWSQRIPFGEPWLSGQFPGFTEFVRDRTETRRKLRVAGGQVARFPEKLFSRSDPGPL